MSVVLPQLLAEFLRTKQYAMLPVASNEGTILVVKMPANDIRECAGRRPIRVDYALHNTRYGPIVRLVLEIFSEPVITKGGDDQSSFILECFFNPYDEEQYADLNDLVRQDHLRMVFFNEALRQVIGKRVTQKDRGRLAELMTQMHRVMAEHDPSTLDIDRAKQIVQDDNPIF